MSTRALIVDDEPLARLRLRTLLSAHEQLEVVAEATNVAEARDRLAQHDVDVVFLDIQMPGGSGFELCDGITKMPAVIFVTAYEEHAIRAFEVNALDYLLKPVHPQRLARCLERLSTSRPPPPPLAPDDRVSLPVGRGLQMLPLSEIRYVRAEGDYTEVHTLDARSILCSISMREWERRLPSEHFARIHRSSIVALAAVDRLQRSGRSGHVVRLRDGGESLEVSRRLVSALRSTLRGLAANDEET